MKKGFLNIKKINENSKINKFNKLIFVQVIMFVLLLAFCMPKTYAQTALAISELEKTGDYKNSSEDNNLSLTQNGITLSVSKENNSELSKDTAIKITAESKNGIKRIEAILYDAESTKIVNTSFYVDSEGSNNKCVLSITTPSCPIENLVLKINVKDKVNEASFERTYLMKKSILTIYSENLNSEMIQGSNVSFYADASNSSVPVKYIEYELKNGSSKLLNGKYYLEDDSYYITEEGKISYKNKYISEGDGTFESEYASSRLTCDIILPNKSCNATLVIKACDILGNYQMVTKEFEIKQVNFTFNVSNKNQTLKVGNKITCSCVSSENFGLSKLEVMITDNDDNFLSKQTKTSSYSSGDKKIECEASVPDKEKIKVYLTATDISGNKKEYGPVDFNVAYNEQDVTPIFVMSSEPKMMGDSEVVSVTSNSGIKFTQLCVKITDEKGNVIKDADGTQKITTVSSSVGKTNLEATINYPETNKDEVYFVFSAKDYYGNVYDGGGVFSELSDTYKKGPISIYSNRITISATPQTGIINKNSEIKLTCKVDVTDSPIEKIEYVYYNKEKKQLPSGLTLNSKMPCILKFTDGKENIETQVNIAKVTSDIIALDVIENNKMKKDGYVLYVSRPYYNSGTFRANAYYLKEEREYPFEIERALYSISTGYEVLDYYTYKENGIIASETIKGPSRSASEIILEVKATDINGKTKVSTFNYYQNKSTIIIESLPQSGTVYSGGYIKAIATSNAGKNVVSFGCEVYENDKLLSSASSISRNENGQIEIDFNMPQTDSNKAIKVIYYALDSDGNLYKETYNYNLLPYSSYTKVNDENLSAIAGRLTGGVNEYVIDYVDENGNEKTYVLNKQEKVGTDYLYTNVKEMEVLSLSSINNILEKNNQTKISKIEDIKKIYIRLNLYYALTCRVNNDDEYVDVTKNIIVTKNDSNYQGIKNANLDLGYGIKLSDIFDIEMRNEIIKKAQCQKVYEIDFNSLRTSDTVKNIYNPEKISQAELKAKTYSPVITFNEEYISGKSVLTSLDFEEGKAFTNSEKTITNNVHVFIDKYKLENYSVKIIDNSIHKNHTYKVDENGEINEECSSECVIYPDTKEVTCYYTSVKEEREISQVVVPDYEIKYLNVKGTMSSMGSGDEVKYDSLGRAFIKVYANYNSKSLYDIVSETEYGDFGIEINSSYKDDGEVKIFTAESNGKWMYFEGLSEKQDDTLNISINPKSYKNSLYYNTQKSRYERSSDRGSVLTFTCQDDVSQIKDIKVAFKTETGYGLTKTLYSFKQSDNVKSKIVDVELPDDVIKNGGNVDIKIWATNYNGEETDGTVSISGKDTKEILSVFINTTKGTNVIPKVNGKSVSLINANGTINTDVLNEIGEGKTNSNSSALKITKVYDTKWVSDTSNYNVSEMALYYNNVNDIIGLGYRVSFSLDTIGYGTDYFVKNNKVYQDKVVCQMKFFAKVNNEYKEVIPFMFENNNYIQCAYSNKFRQIVLESNPNTNNDNSLGLNSLKINGQNVTWNFSYYLPANVKFKLKDDLDGEYVSINEIAVQMDIDLYKYYSISEDTSEYIKNGQYNDSRHLYTLRENLWNNNTTGEVKAGNSIIKNVKVKLRNLIDTTKGLAFWYDVIKNATYDITGQKSY